MNDLSLATVPELLDELEKRHDVMIFVGRPTINKDFSWRMWTTGPTHEALGLCSLAQFSLAQKAINDIQPEPN